MPPSQSTEPVLQKPLHKHVAWLYLIFLTIIILGGFIYLTWGQGIFGITFGGTGKTRAALPTDLIAAQRSGDLEAAQQALQSASPTTPDDRALVTLNARGLAFEASGNPSDLVKDVDDLKSIFLDQSVSLPIRIQALNQLSVEYDDSGNNAQVFNEIYKDGAFKNLLVAGDPELSARHLAEWSYSLYPTSFSAVTIASWYAANALIDTTLSKVQQANYEAKSESYLTIADQLAAQETKQKPDFLNTSRYMTYRYLKALSFAKLGALGVSPYAVSYAKEMQDAIAVTESQQNVTALEYRPYLRFYYARFASRIDHNDTEAKTQLDTLAKELSALQSPATSSFVRFIRNTYQNDKNGQVWGLVRRMMSLSSDFKTEVHTLNK
jgi:hypothetical protein